MIPGTKEIAEQELLHTGPTPEYQEWLARVKDSRNLQELTDTFKGAYLKHWHHDFIQYQVLKRIYAIAQPHPVLYLYLQITAVLTGWSPIEEAHGMFLLLAFFYFPTHIIVLYERILYYLWYSRSNRLLKEALQHILQLYPQSPELEQILQYVDSQPQNAKSKLPDDLLEQLNKRRQELYAEEGLHFLDELKLRSDLAKPK